MPAKRNLRTTKDDVPEKAKIKPKQTAAAPKSTNGGQEKSLETGSGVPPKARLKQVQQRAANQKAVKTANGTKEENPAAVDDGKPAKRRRIKEETKPSNGFSIEVRIHGAGEGASHSARSAQDGRKARSQTSSKLTRLPKVRPIKSESSSTSNVSEVKKETPVEDGSIKSMESLCSNGALVRTGLKYVGAHVSAAGNLSNAVKEAVEIGAKSFALFLRSQRQWAAKPLLDNVADEFRKACQDNGFHPNFILPHGSYLLNLGSPDDATITKSRDLLIDELQRCERLGLLLYNVHPGSSCGKIPKDKCLELIAESINLAHSKTKIVKVVLENMSRQGHTVGGDFQELKTIIDMVDDKSRIGVCVDTCHAFAAGYDVSSEEGLRSTIQEFDDIIGLKYLVAVHLNDSKGPLGCHLDRHENIGKGRITEAGFMRIMNSPCFNDIPLILETPCEEDNTYRREIKLLNSYSARKH